MCVGEGEEGIRFRCEGGPIHLSQGRRHCPCKFNRNNPLIINMAGLVLNMNIFVSNITGLVPYATHFFPKYCCIVSKYDCFCPK